MSDPKFEQQVRQKLTDLKLTPTPQAWENIEEKLRERKRRTPFLWLSLVLVGLVAGGYLFFNTPSEVNNNGHEQIPLNHDSKNPATGLASTSGRLPVTVNPSASASSSEDETSSSFKNTDDQNLLSLKDNSSRNNLINKNSISNNSVNNNSSVNNKPATNKPITDNSVSKRISSAKNNVKRNNHNFRSVMNADDADTVVSSNKNIGENKLLKGESSNGKAPVNKTSEETKAVDSNKNHLAKILTQPKPDSNLSTPSVPKLPSKKQKDSKWSYAVDLQAGMAAENQGRLFNFKRAKVEDVAFTATFAGTTANFAPVYKPSIITPGFMFSAGALVKRELSKRFSVSAGVNYTQLNTNSKVGDHISANNIVNNGASGYLYVQSYYRLSAAAEDNDHKNTYHFIEIPVSLHTRLNNSMKLPVYWDAGVVVSRLLSSTSLHFDGTTGVYYKNDRLLNQTQAGLTTGFSVALFNQTSRPLWIGPSVRSNISSVLKKDVSDTKHFVTLGLDMKWFLKR